MTSIISTAHIVVSSAGEARQHAAKPILVRLIDCRMGPSAVPPGARRAFANPVNSWLVPYANGRPPQWLYD